MNSPRLTRSQRRRLLPRREFLSRASIAATSALALTGFARAADPPRAIGLGFSLYGMKNLPTDEALKALADIGYDCTELTVMPDWPADSARFDSTARKSLRDQLASRKLRLTSLMENLPALGDDAQHRTHLDRLKRAAEMARDLTQGTHRPLIETILGGKPGEFDAVKNRLIDRLRDYTKIAADAEVPLAIKAHIGNATQQPKHLLQLLDAIASPWLVAAYDYSHFQLQKLDMRETLDALLPRSRFIHVKDGQSHQGKTAFLLPGEGTIDYVALFQHIAQSTYRGDIVVEVSSQVSNRPNYEALAAARQCYNHLSTAFTRANLPRA